MERNKIIAALIEARRFVERAEAAISETDESDYCLDAGKLSGSLRRSSMDLTRSLAEMRGRSS